MFTWEPLRAFSKSPRGREGIRISGKFAARLACSIPAVTCPPGPIAIKPSVPATTHPSIRLPPRAGDMKMSPLERTSAGLSPSASTRAPLRRVTSSTPKNPRRPKGLTERWTTDSRLAWDRSMMPVDFNLICPSAPSVASTQNSPPPNAAGWSSPAITPLFPCAKAMNASASPASAMYMARVRSMEDVCRRVMDVCTCTRPAPSPASRVATINEAINAPPRRDLHAR